jgi:hypothetical protein
MREMRSPGILCGSWIRGDVGGIPPSLRRLPLLRTDKGMLRQLFETAGDVRRCSERLGPAITQAVREDQTMAAPRYMRHLPRCSKSSANGAKATPFGPVRMRKSELCKPTQKPIRNTNAPITRVTTLRVELVIRDRIGVATPPGRCLFKLPLPALSHPRRGISIFPRSRSRC